MEEPEFNDALFRVHKKNGEWKPVDTPRIGAVLADAHTHLQYLTNPVMALARAGMNEVSFMCTVLDVQEDDESVFANVKKWTHQAAVTMQLMLGRC